MSINTYTKFGWFWWLPEVSVFWIFQQLLEGFFQIWHELSGEIIFAKFLVLEQLVAIRILHFFVWASSIHLCRWNGCFLCSNSADIDGWRFPNFRRIQRMWSCKCHCLMVPWVFFRSRFRGFLGKKIKDGGFYCQMSYTSFFSRMQWGSSYISWILKKNNKLGFHISIHSKLVGCGQDSDKWSDS